MKKIINKKTYNTETATMEGHFCFGVFGQTDGFEEKLFKTKKGDWFLYGFGGCDSKYTKETLLPLSDEEAKNWIKEHK